MDSDLIKTSSDKFYDNLCKLNESSGLSLLFNFRKTSLDLFKFYEQVTRRGGYHQVTKDSKWGEVGCSVNPESSPLLPDQLRKIYENLLCPFEKLHYYRSTLNVAATSAVLPVPIVRFGAVYLSRGKRKCFENSDKISSVAESVDNRLTRKTSVEDKDKKDVTNASPKPRSAYQLFIRKEFERLKEIEKESSERHIRGMAIKAWRSLPEKKRKPYIDESNEEKKRIAQQLKTNGITIKSISLNRFSSSNTMM